MANLYVTFSSAFPNPRRDRAVPLAIGSVARTEILEIGSASGGSNTGSITATDAENVVELLADADCWVAIGSAPDPESENRWLLKASQRYQFTVATGEAVAALEL